jgi:ParB family chromosome partitioning protein
MDKPLYATTLTGQPLDRQQEPAMSQPLTAESLRIGGLDPHAEFAPPTDREPQLARVKLELLRPNPNQPRKHFGEPELQELMESIRQAGLIQPIAVRPSVAGSYLIVAGERRYRAFQRLSQEDRQYATIPAIIQYRSDQEVAVAALIENVVREDLNPIERAQALQDLKKALKLSWEGVAAKVGLSVRHVYFLTGMLKLRKDFREAVDAGQLTEKHARALGKLSAQPEQAWRLFEYLTAHPQLTGDDALDLVTWMRKHPGLSPDAAQEARTAALHKPEPAKPTRKATAAPVEPDSSSAGLLPATTAPVASLQAALAVLHDLNPAQLSGQDRETLRQTLFALQFKTLQLLAGVAATDQVAPVPVAPGATATAVAHPDVQWPNHLDAVTEPSSAPTAR